MVHCHLQSHLKEHPFWRTQEQKDNGEIPTIPDMLHDIVGFIKKWNQLKCNIKDEKKHFVEEQLKKIGIDFFVSIQVEEGIGMSTQEDNDVTQEKDKIKEDTENVLRKFEELKMSKKNHKRLSYERSMSEDRVLRKYKKHQEEKEKPCAKNELELINLYIAHKNLKNLADLEKCHPEKFCQLLATEVIKNTHATLMADLLDGKTAPGQFSTSERIGSFDNKEFKYPSFQNEEVANDVIDALIDNYNSAANKLQQELGKNEINESILQRVFQSAAKFLFIFLQLHPFADGNGRLGRLLCSYFLELICPFPSSIYNVYSPTKRSDYVEVLIQARKDINFNKKLSLKEEGISFLGELIDHDESNLASLIIESNWFSWKKFMDIIESKFEDELSKCPLM